MSVGWKQWITAILTCWQIACCGADGPGDYLSLQQPLPSQCRDTVTGNPFFHGCVSELTWFFEQKCAWVAGLAMTVCFFHVSIFFYYYYSTTYGFDEVPRSSSHDVYKLASRNVFLCNHILSTGADNFLCGTNSGMLKCIKLVINLKFNDF